MERLRGQIAFDQRRAGVAAPLLLGAARRLEPLDADLARETHLEALGAAMWVGDLEQPRCRAGGGRGSARRAPGPDPPRAVDLLLDAIAIRQAEGFAAAAPLLTRALEPILALNLADQDAVTGSCSPIPVSDFIALELWDAESWHALAARQVQFGRDTGALVRLQFALNFMAWTHLLAGEMTTAALLLEERARDRGRDRESAGCLHRDCCSRHGGAGSDRRLS